MNRREFCTTAGLTVAAGSNCLSKLANSSDSNSGETDKDKIDQARHEVLQELCTRNDVSIDAILAAQQNEKSKPFFGGFANTNGIFPVGKAAASLRSLACGLVNPKSRHFESQSVQSSMLKAMQFIKSQQHADGTIDLVTTNFHSPPDTGFVVEPVAMALVLIHNHDAAGCPEFQKNAQLFLGSAGKALSIGGIHTPNHRWVVCQALARINAIFPDKSLVNRIDQWLAEGIDIDAEGHFRERSTSIYSPLTDRCLITVSRLLDRPGLLTPVRNNLDLTPYLVHHNGEIVTEVSRRQDQFRIAKMGNYYYPYRYMAIHDSNGLYAAMAKMIEETNGNQIPSQNLAYAMEDESFLKPLPKQTPISTNYVRSYAQSKIVRIRRDAWDTTILADNETFLTIHKGAAALRAIRFASAFFGKGQFQSDQIQEANGSYVLKQTLDGPYFQPLPSRLVDGDGDWEKLPMEKRSQTEIQRLETEVRITENRGVLKIEFQIAGTKGVPVAIELAFGKNGSLAGVESIEQVEDAFLLNDKGCTYQVGGDKISVSGATPNHRWTQLRGASPKLDAQCVYVTEYTPVKLELTIS